MIKKRDELGVMPLNIGSQIIHGWMKRQPSRRMMFLVETILVLLLASQLASLSWLMIDAWLSSDSDQRTVQSVAVKPSSLSQYEPSFEALQSVHLFGKPAPEQGGEAALETVDIQAIPVSRLRVKVTGLVAHPEPAKALVVIDNAGQQNTYRIGDEIDRSSATIENIFPDRVIINNRGKLEAILLYPDEQSKPLRGAVRPDIEAIGQQLVDNPALLSDLVSIVPVRSDGALTGYRITPKQHQALLLRQG